jgi:D-3-phosphoglycerate dehydrogenase
MGHRYSVIVTEAPYFSESMQQILNEVDAELKLAPCTTATEVISQASEADTIITTKADFSKPVIEGLNRCRFILRCGIGMDNFDIPAATEKGILIANLPEWYVEDLANHIMAFILDSSRKITQIDRLVRSGEYSLDKIKPVRQLKDRVLGFVGFGKNAISMLPKLKAFNFRILVYDPYTSNLPQDVEGVDLDALLSRSDFVVVSCPLTEETRGIIGDAEFKLMKAEAYLINSARGAIVDEDALIRALRQKEIAGVATDVLANEPVTEREPLLEFDNVLITPHIAWYSEEAIEEARIQAAENVVRFIKGDLPSHPLNPEALNSQKAP